MWKESEKSTWRDVTPSVVQRLVVSTSPGRFFFFNANAWTPPIPTESESLGLGFRYLKKFSSDSYVLCSLKSTDPTGYMWDSVGTGHGDSGGVYTVDCTSVYAGRDCLFKRW